MVRPDSARCSLRCTDRHHVFSGLAGHQQPRPGLRGRLALVEVPIPVVDALNAQALLVQAHLVEVHGIPTAPMWDFIALRRSGGATRNCLNQLATISASGLSIAVSVLRFGMCHRASPIPTSPHRFEQSSARQTAVTRRTRNVQSFAAVTLVVCASAAGLRHGMIAARLTSAWPTPGPRWCQIGGRSI